MVGKVFPASLCGLCVTFQVLELRLQQWLAAGRSCLIVGDLNISPAAIDSCHPPAEFDHQRSDRLWLNKLLAPNGPGVVDAFRLFHPSRYAAGARHAAAVELV
jgi:exonuclease III